MIKTLLLSTITALTLATPALALDYPGDRGGNTSAPRTGNTSQTYCAFTYDQSDRFLDEDIFVCKVTSRTNVNGHKVWDIQAGDLKTTVVLWNDGTAEFWQEGERYTGTWGNMDGHTVIYDNESNYHFAF